MFEGKPCVYLVGQSYQIVFRTDGFGIAWVEVGSERYLDEENGLMRSETTVHRTVVPAAQLDAVGEYTVCFRALPERKPYWPELGAEERQTYRFYSAANLSEVRLCHIADAHSQVELAVRTAQQLAQPADLLVLNGDIPAESKTKDDLHAILDIAGGITGGEHPVIYVRGNHDTRGRYALDLPDYVGNDERRTYYTFRTGGIWGIALDCGEDKLDDSREYGGIVCCHAFRKKQTDFLRRVLENRADEFDAPGVRTRLAFCHIPFPTALVEDQPIFDIEREIYGEWTALLNEMGIDLMLCGHMHTLHVLKPGDPLLRYDANFPLVVASELFSQREHPEQTRFSLGEAVLSGRSFRVDFVDNHGARREALRV